MATDPRETVREFFAERACCGAHSPGASAPERCPFGLQIADAILGHPGVEVVEERLVSAGEGWGWLRNDEYERATHTQVVIRLPAQPIGETT